METKVQQQLYCISLTGLMYTNGGTVSSHGITASKSVTPTYSYPYPYLTTVMHKLISLPLSCSIQQSVLQAQYSRH